MTSFSSLLSSVGTKQPEAPQSSASKSVGSQTARPPNGGTNRYALTPNNAAAGVKRRSEEPASAPAAKSIKIENSVPPSRPAAAPPSRFRLSDKPSITVQSSSRPATPKTASSNPQRTLPKQPPKPAAENTSVPAAPADTAPKKGFAAILAKAKEVQAAHKDAPVGGIKHRRFERLPEKEKKRIREAERAQQRAGKKSQAGLSDRSRSGTPIGMSKPGNVQKKPVEPLSYKGTMKKAVPPLGYKGTMKPVGSGAPKPGPKKGEAQDKYGGYASWSDLDEAEDEEEEDYDSDDDMEAGFDDVEGEETLALRAARKEDQEALAEEERLKKEKLERQKKLQALSKNAAAKKRY